MPSQKQHAVVTIQLDAGQANPGKVGQSLGSYGVNIAQVIRAYNTATEHRRGEVVPAVVTVYEDRSFSLELKSPPTSFLLRKAAGVERGSGRPHTDRAGTITRDELERIAKVKLPDLNTDDLAAACKIIAGTARSMGIAIVD